MKHLKLYENFDDSTDLAPLAKQIGDAISEVFPESYVNSKVSKGFGTTISIGFTIGKDKTEWANGIAENDPVGQSIIIFPEGANLSVESRTGGLMIKPPAGSHLAYGRIKTPWRNFKSGKPEDVVRKLKDYFTKLKKLIADNIEEFHDKDKELIKKKI